MVIALDKKENVNAIRIHWGDPYAREFEVQYWVGDGTLTLAIQSRQVFPRRRLHARGLRQSTEKLLVAFSRVPPHNRPHRRVSLQRGRVNPDPLALDQPTIRQ